MTDLLPANESLPLWPSSATVRSGYVRCRSRRGWRRHPRRGTCRAGRGWHSTILVHTVLPLNSGLMISLQLLKTMLPSGRSFRRWLLGRAWQRNSRLDLLPILAVVTIPVMVLAGVDLTVPARVEITPRRSSLGHDDFRM